MEWNLNGWFILRVVNGSLKHVRDFNEFVDTLNQRLDYNCDDLMWAS